jgi:hypothetical protein
MIAFCLVFKKFASLVKTVAVRHVRYSFLSFFFPFPFSFLFLFLFSFSFSFSFSFPFPFYFHFNSILFPSICGWSKTKENISSIVLD